MTADDIDLRHELQGMAALHTTLARMEGHKIDKAAARWSAMADYMMHCGSVVKGGFSEAVARSALWEAVETAIIDNPMWIENTPFDRAAYAWMEAPDQTRSAAVSLIALPDPGREQL